MSKKINYRMNGRRGLTYTYGLLDELVKQATGDPESLTAQLAYVFGSINGAQSIDIEIAGSVYHFFLVDV